MKKLGLLVTLIIACLSTFAQAPPPSSSPPPSVGLPIDDHAWILFAACIFYTLYEHNKIELQKRLRLTLNKIKNRP